ncbi:MAG: outer membrane lipoprotein chaperone LolA [Vicinamibacterales bacterium]
MRLQLSLPLIAALALGLPSWAQSPPAQEVAAALQKKYDGIRDFSADFTQTTEGGVLRRKPVAERGTVFVKKPGRMRWNYKSPEEKVFVSDGRQIQLYVPADKQVIVSPLPSDDRATSAVLFLMGRGNLTRDFNVSYGQGGTDNTHVLRLDPKTRQAEYDWLQLTVDRASLQIRELTAGDQQGGRSTFRFTNFKENPGVTDKTFAFTAPPGTDVVKSGQGR